MALKWWENAGIIESESETTRQKAETLVNNFLKKKEERRAWASEELLNRKYEAGKMKGIQLQAVFQSKAAEELEAVGIDASSANITRQIRSGHTWVDSLVQQAEAESRQDRIDAATTLAKQWAQYKARQAGITWTDLSPDEQQTNIDSETQRILAEKYPDEFTAPVSTTEAPASQETQTAIQNVLTTTFSDVTGDFGTWAQSNQDEFLRRLQEGGQTPDKTAFLRELMPEVSDNEIKSLFITDEQIDQTVNDLDNLFSTSISKTRSGTLTPQEVSAFSLARDAIARTFVATGEKREGYPNVAYNIESGWLNEFSPELKKKLAYAYLVDPYKGNEFASLMADLGQIPNSAGGTLANLLVAPVSIIGTPFAKKSVGEPVSAQEWVTAGAMLALLIAEPIGGVIGGIGGRAMTTGLRTFGAGVFTADTVIDWDKMSHGQRIFMVAMDIMLVAGVVSGIKTELSSATPVKDVFNKYLKGQDAKTASTAIDDIVAGIKKKNPNVVQSGITRLGTVIDKLPDDVRARVEKRLTLMGEGVPDIIKMTDLVKPQDASKLDNAIKTSSELVQTGKTESVENLIRTLKAKIQSKQTKAVEVSTNPTEVVTPKPEAVKPTATTIGGGAKAFGTKASAEGETVTSREWTTTTGEGFSEGIVESVAEKQRPLFRQLRTAYQEAIGDIRTIQESVKGQTDVGSRLIKLTAKNTQRVLQEIDALVNKVERKKTITDNEITDLTARLQRTKETLATLKSEGSLATRLKQLLIDYAKENLPLNERGKLLSIIKNAKTAVDFQKAITKIENLAEQSTQRELRSEIVKELSNIKPTKDKGILKGKFTADVQEQLDAVRHNLNIDRDVARERIAKNVEDFNNGLLEYDEMLKQNEILNMAGIKGMSSEELANTLNNIRSLKTEGRTLRKIVREEWKANAKTNRGDAVTEVTGGKGIRPGTESGAAEAEYAAKLKFADRVENSQFSIWELVDKLTKLTRKPFKGTKMRELLVKNVYRAREVESEALLRINEEIKSRALQIFGVTKQGELNRVFRRMGKEEITLGTFKNTDGNSVTLKLTKGQIIKKYQELLDPTLEKTFTDGMKWTDEIKNAIKNSLTPEEKAWADYQMEFYSQYYDAINKVYRELYGVDLSRNSNYSPLSRDFVGEIPEDQLVYKDLARYASTLNGALKARIANIRPLKFTDANEVFMNHFQQMEHFQAWTEPMRELRSVFSNKDVRRAILQYHGKDILRQLDTQLNRIANSGIDTAHIVRSLDWLRGNFSKAVIGLKPYQMLQQLPTVFAPLVDMKFSDLMSGVVDFWKNPVKNYKWLMENSSYIKSRYKQGFERDIAYAKQTGGFRTFISGKMSTDAMYFLMQTGDKFGVMQSFWAKYKTMLGKYGDTVAGRAKAMEEAGVLMDRVQNTSAIDTLSNLQTGGSWWKLLTMFQSQPNKYFRVIASSLRDIKYGRGNRAKAATNVALAWVILPSIFQLIADGFQWRKNRQATALVLGPINNLLVIGQLAQAVGDRITGERFPYAPSPVVSGVDDFLDFVSKTRSIINKGQDPYKDITAEDIASLLELLAKSTGEITGVPTPYMIQLEKAIRSGDPRQILFTQWALGEEGTKPDRDGVSQYLYGKNYNQLTPDEQARVRELVG